MYDFIRHTYFNIYGDGLDGVFWKCEETNYFELDEKK